LKFVADENVDRPIVELLRKSGYIVYYVQEMEPGITDEQVIQRANEEGALLLTSDSDFGELVFRQGKFVQGIILMRLVGLSFQRKGKILLETIKEHEDNLYGNFTVISPSAIRIRTAKYLRD
jgi:predicted nuclease of predicted toxin-antitoxin system